MGKPKRRRPLPFPAGWRGDNAHKSDRVLGLSQSSGNTCGGEEIQEKRHRLYVDIGFRAAHRLSHRRAADGRFPFRGSFVIVGVFVSLIMLLVDLLRCEERNRPCGRALSPISSANRSRSGRDDPSITYTEYTVAITTDTGKKKTIVEKDPRRYMYDYLSVGDRVRYHPKFSTYEKYDKSKDRIIYCIVCTTMNPIQNDRCKRCNNLLFK